MSKFRLNKYLPNTWSFIAIGFSILAIGFSLFRIIPFEVGNDIYIGIISTLIGVCVTIMFGSQILSMVEVNKKLKRIDELEQEVRKQQRKQEIDYIRSEGNFLFVQGQSLMFLSLNTREEHIKNHCLLKAFISFHSSLSHLIEADYRKLEVTLSNLENCITDLTCVIINKYEYDNILDYDSRIRNNELFSMIGSKYESIFSMFLTKLKTK